MNPKFSIDLPKVKLLNGHLLTLCMYEFTACKLQMCLREKYLSYM